MYFMRFYLFCSGDLVTGRGEWETRSVSGRLRDNPGQLAYMPHNFSELQNTQLNLVKVAFLAI